MERWLDHGIELDNAVIDGHPGVTFGFHLCRGNQGSRWLVSGGYERDRRGRCSAECTPTGCCWSTTTSDQAPSSRSARCPTTRMVVLGLVTTKILPAGGRAELEARIREAARHVDSGTTRDQPPMRVCHLGDRQRDHP